MVWRVDGGELIGENRPRTFHRTNLKEEPMKRIIPSLAVCLLLSCLAIAVHATPETSNGQTLTGSWQCMSHGGTQGSMAFTLDLEQNGTTVSGSVSSPIGDADISSATFKDNTLRIEIDGGDSQYVLTAKYSNGKLTGSWKSTSGEKGTWSGAKGQPSTK
jgi:hypothetical protein